MTRSLAALSMLLLAAACNSEKSEPPLPTTPVQGTIEAKQAPLELALKPRQHGDLICHFHHPGAVYDVHVTPLRVTTIVFQEDERVVTIGAGDTERFNVDLTETDGRHALLVKPVERDIATNISVVTDRRVYVLNLISDRQTNYVIAFEPFDEEKLEPVPVRSDWPLRPLARPQGTASGPLENVAQNHRGSDRS